MSIRLTLSSLFALAAVVVLTGHAAQPRDPLAPVAQVRATTAASPTAIPTNTPLLAVATPSPTAAPTSLTPTVGPPTPGPGESVQTTAHYALVLSIGPVETMLMPDQTTGARSGEVMAQMPGMPMVTPATTDEGQPVNHHVEVHVRDLATGAVVSDHVPSIIVVDEGAGTSRQLSSVMPMYDVAKGQDDLHFGQNVFLAPGTYSVRVEIGAEGVVFRNLSVGGAEGTPVPTMAPMEAGPAPGAVAQAPVPVAEGFAYLTDASGRLVGVARLTSIGNGVQVDARFAGLAPGSHGLDLEAGAGCDATPATTAGTAAALPALSIDDDGSASYTGTASGATLIPDATILAAYTSDAVASGRIACGVLQAGALRAADGHSILDENAAIQALFTATWGIYAPQEWVLEHDAQIGAR